MTRNEYKEMCKEPPDDSEGQRLLAELHEANKVYGHNSDQRH